MGVFGILQRTIHRISPQPDYESIPVLFNFRSRTLFILSTVGIGLFTDLFLYGLVVPVLPFMITDRAHIPEEQIQSFTSALLAAYAAASVVFSPVAGAIADRTSSRQLPFLSGLTALIIATFMLFLGQNIAVLTIARVFQGASSAFVWTIGLALCIDTVGPGNLGKTIGSILSFVSVGALFAPVVGGVLYDKAGYIGVGAVAIAVLVLDFVMRLLVIEKKVAARYIKHNPKLRQHRQDENHEQVSSQNDGNDEHQIDHDTEDAQDESTTLLPKDKSEDSDYYKIPQPQPRLIQSIPLLYCLSSPSLVLALIVALVQATLLSCFDATIPTHAHDLYDYNSLTSSLLFIPLGVSNVIIGPLAGWSVDRFGSKPAAVVGYAFLVPVLALLRLPTSASQDDLKQPILYAVILGLCGVGIAVIGAPSIVEAGAVVEKFHKRNPEIFGENGPYASLYSLNSMVFCLGLSVGPVISGGLSKAIGYGNMNAVLAGMCGITSLACYVYLGGRPRVIQRGRR